MTEYPGVAHELPEGEMFWIADHTILVDHTEVIATMAFKFGEAGTQPAIFLTFLGRINNSGGEPDSVTVAISAHDAPHLVEMINNAASIIDRHNG
jgi:hypothetical protein